jgi:hypothetical protein
MEPPNVIARSIQSAKPFLEAWSHMLDTAAMKVAMAGWRPDTCLMSVDPAGRVGLWIDVKGELPVGGKIPGTLVYEQWVETPTAWSRKEPPPEQITISIRHKWHVTDVPQCAQENTNG